MATHHAVVWQPAVVVIDGRGKHWLKFSSLNSCERCLAGQGCGAGVFSRLFSRRHARLPLPARAEWRPGQRVRVGLSSRRLLTMALLLYGLPLVGFLVGVATFHFLLLDHAWRDLAALLGGLMLAALFCLPARLGWGAGRNPRIEALSS